MAVRATCVGLIFWLISFISRIESQQDLDPKALLVLASKRILENVERQRRFACDATILREFYGTKGSSPQLRFLKWRDRVHVEVAVFEGKQLFSWPGTGAFRFESLDEITGEGISSTGYFGSFAASFLADSDPASIRFRGIEELAGQLIARYSYEVPLSRSHYVIPVAQHRNEITAYQGSMFISTRTGNLRRLVIKVLSPPADSGVVEAEVDTSYEPERTPASSGLIPSTSSLDLTLTSGGEAVNRTAYQSCRIFGSESSLRFDTVPGSPPEPERTPSRLTLPAALRVRSVMTMPIDSRTSFAGDIFEARLVNPIQLGKRILVPNGALLHGRIVQLKQQYYPNISVRVGLRFSSVEFDGQSVPISLAARGSTTSGDNLRSPDATIVPPENPLESGEDMQHVAVIWVFGKDHIRLDKHTVSLWETR